MIERRQLHGFRLLPIAAIQRIIIGLLLTLVLASCASQSVREAQQAAAGAAVAQAAARVAAKQGAARIADEQEAERVAAAQTAARLAQQEQEQEQEQVAELQRQREQQAAERTRVEAERARQLAQARAGAEAERQQKMDRITALEQQIASIQSEIRNGESGNDDVAEAILITEELLMALAAEQAKYENTDTAGNTVEPLAKELIAELESRKNELLRRANSQ